MTALPRYWDYDERQERKELTEIHVRCDHLKCCCLTKDSPESRALSQPVAPVQSQSHITHQEKLLSWYLTRVTRPDLCSVQGGLAPTSLLSSPLLSVFVKVPRSAMDPRLEEEVINHLAVFIRYKLPPSWCISMWINYNLIKVQVSFLIIVKVLTIFIIIKTSMLQLVLKFIFQEQFLILSPFIWQWFIFAAYKMYFLIFVFVSLTAWM